ncbi:phage major capsid protein [Halosegnis longus]|uniref:phage major capsid protein n=1 Tax=Halosegnis longus TaxID=2216012 RepID=UPI00129DB1D5|nr:hypothetical protein [Halosegnis longus]
MSSQTPEELSVNFEDIDGTLSQPVLRSRVEEIVQETLHYREAFRPYDATGIQSNVVQMPVPKDEMGSPKIVGENSEFPRDQEHYELEVLEFDKYGFEVQLSMEAQADSQSNLVANQLDRQAEEMAEEMNRQAFLTIQNAIGDDVYSQDGAGSNGVMEFSDILAGREALMQRSYNPDLLIVDVPGVHDLMTADNFLDATDQQSSMRRSGSLGRTAGFDVMEADDGLNITGNDNPGAVMIDTNYFGWEGERTPITAEEYDEKRNQSDIYRLFNRMGWLATQSDAGVIIEG